MGDYQPKNGFVDGIENLFQIETASELLTMGANVTVWGKVKLDGDLVVDGDGVELRCQQPYGKDVLTQARASVLLNYSS